MVQQQQLKEVGSKLESPPASKDALIKLLKVIMGEGGLSFRFGFWQQKMIFFLSIFFRTVFFTKRYNSALSFQVCAFSSAVNFNEGFQLLQCCLFWDWVEISFSYALCFFFVQKWNYLCPLNRPLLK